MTEKRPGIVDYIAWISFEAVGLYSRYMPRRMRYWGFGSVLLLAFYTWKSRVKVAIGHLKIAFPEASEEKLKRIAYLSYINLAAFCTEYFQMPKITIGNMDRYIRFSGLERLDEAYKRGKGVVLVWAHYDHFEMVNYALAVKGYKVYTLIRKVDNLLIDEMLDKVRESSGQRIIKRDGAAAEVIRRLREGAIVTIATDQNALFNHVFIKFFGKWASTVKSPAVVHLRTGAPIFPVYSVREKDDSHSAVILPEIKAAPTGELKKDVAAISQKIAEAQEAFIAQRPEFWLWMHKRWKIQPNEKELAEILAR
jgi:KDO2-lipid IV(A) lauroyltransferase